MLSSKMMFYMLVMRCNWIITHALFEIVEVLVCIVMIRWKTSQPIGIN